MPTPPLTIASYSYDPSLADAVSRIRDLTGDTSVGDSGARGRAHFADETIQYYYAKIGDETGAAVTLLRNFARWLRTQPRRKAMGGELIEYPDAEKVQASADLLAAEIGEGGTWERVEAFSDRYPRMPFI